MNSRWQRDFKQVMLCMTSLVSNLTEFTIFYNLLGNAEGMYTYSSVQPIVLNNLQGVPQNMTFDELFNKMSSSIIC